MESLRADGPGALPPLAPQGEAAASGAAANPNWGRANERGRGLFPKASICTLPMTCTRTAPGPNQGKDPKSAFPAPSLRLYNCSANPPPQPITRHCLKPGERSGNIFWTFLACGSQRSGMMGRHHRRKNKINFRQWGYPSVTGQTAAISLCLPNCYVGHTHTVPVRCHNTGLSKYPSF